MEFFPIFLMVSVALTPTVVGLLLLRRARRQFNEGIQGLTDPNRY